MSESARLFVKQRGASRRKLTAHSPMYLLAFALLAGCGSDQAEPAPSVGDEAPETLSADSGVAEGELSPQPEGRTAPDTSGSSGATSVYSDLDLADCEVIRTHEELGSSDYRCPGIRGIPVFVSEGDLRVDIDVGVPNDRWSSPSAFNSPGNTLEWRMVDDDPAAVIVRYQVEGGPGAADRSDLAVIRVGREGDPGCLVAWVPADAEPSQNEAARSIADARAASFDCSESVEHPW